MVFSRSIRTSGIADRTQQPEQTVILDEAAVGPVTPSEPMTPGRHLRCPPRRASSLSRRRQTKPSIGLNLSDALPVRKYMHQPRSTGFRRRITSRMSFIFAQRRREVSADLCTERVHRTKGRPPEQVALPVKCECTIRRWQPRNSKPSLPRPSTTRCVFSGCSSRRSRSKIPRSDDEPPRPDRVSGTERRSRRRTEPACRGEGTSLATPDRVHRGTRWPAAARSRRLAVYRHRRALDAVLHHSGLEPLPDQLQHAPVRDARRRFSIRRS